MSLFVRTLSVLLLSSVAATAHADKEVPPHLQCAGIFFDYRNGAPSELPIVGVSVRVSQTGVIVAGSAGFDGEYEISLRRDDGIGFTARKNTLYGGFLNRFSGELGLHLAKDPERSSFAFMYQAKCVKAKPLF